MRRFAIFLGLMLACGETGERSPECQVCDPLAVDFGEVSVGTVASRRVRFRNEGDAPLRLRAVRPADVKAPFATDFLCGRVCQEEEIPPGSDIELGFTFAPTGAGLWNTEVRIGTSEGQDLVVHLGGMAKKPRLDCDPVEFTLLPDAPPKDVAVTCTNPFASPVTATPAITSGDFELVWARELTFEPGASRDIDLRFPTHGLGEHDGLLELTDPHGASLAMVSLRARVVAVAVNVDYGVADGECIDFGDVPVGATATWEVTAANPTDNPAMVTLRTIGDGFQAGSATVRARSSLTLDVSFTPTTAGEKTGSIWQSGVDDTRCLTGRGI